MRKTLHKAMLSIALIYIGVILLFFPYFLSFRSAASSIMEMLGLISIFAGIISLLYSKLSAKIDNISDNIFNLKEAGIEKIISTTNSYEQLEEFVYHSDNAKIAINVYRLTDKFCYFLNSLLDNEFVKFQLMFLGPIDDSKTYSFIETLHKKHKKNIDIKVLNDLEIDNLVIFSGKSCVMHYNNCDNKLSFFIVFYTASEENHKNTQLFERLWKEGKEFLISGEGEKCP